MEWWEEKPKPSRAYAFKKRVDRQRIAHRLASGMRVTEVARIERCEPEDIDKLLHDRTFQALVRHWEEVVSLDPEARLQRLTDMAMALIELGIASGDLRVAMFVARERKAGRHPARTVAKRLVATIERRAGQTEPRPEPPPDRPPREPPAATATPPHAATEPFAFCAATQGSGAGAANLAEAELGRVPARLARAGAVLAQSLAAECERIGTAIPTDPIQAARMIGRALQRDAGGAFDAAWVLDAQARAYRNGEPPPPAPDTG